MIYALCWTIKSRFYRRFDEANFLIRMKKCSEKFCFLRHRIMKTVVFPNILVSLGQNKNISMKTVARTFLLLFLCSLQGKAAFYSDKAANLLNTLDSLMRTTLKSSNSANRLSTG